jgi:hypothetical protein
MSPPAADVLRLLSEALADDARRVWAAVRALPPGSVDARLMHMVLAATNAAKVLSDELKRRATKTEQHHMSETKFTPGPWRRSPVNGNVICDDRNEYHWRGGPSDPDLLEANARLVAAAPALFAAALAAYELITTLPGVHPLSNDAHAKVIDDLSAALNAADPR